MEGISDVAVCCMLEDVHIVHNAAFQDVVANHSTIDGGLSMPTSNTT